MPKDWQRRRFVIKNGALWNNIYNYCMPEEMLPSHKPIRLKNYDYSSPGAYFVTLCSFQKKRIFSTIENNNVFLTTLGAVIDIQWKELLNRYPNISLPEYVIMPNHFHGIVTIHDGNSETLGNMIRAFKSLTTRNRPQKDIAQIWQLGFYERVIRNQSEFNAIQNYIIQNPENWLKDEYNA